MLPFETNFRTNGTGTSEAVFSIQAEDMNDWWPLDNQRQSLPTLEQYEQFRITKEKDIPNPEPTITIANAAIASPGNITGISAAAKAGKTALTGVILAGAISQTGNIDGFDFLKVLPNDTCKAVIHFDTEQSEADQQYSVNKILKRAGFESTPEYYRSYNLRQLTLENYKETTDNICELCDEKYEGVHLIVIDGGADFIASVNDEAEAHNIVQYFIHLAIRYNCPVIIIVHLNPGSDKERGHFGSEVQRKCYGLMKITKEGDISTAQPKIMRKACNEEIPLLHFKYSKEKGYHIQIDGSEKSIAKSGLEMEMTRKMAAIVFAPPASLTHKEAISKIMKHTQKGVSTAKKHLTNMLGFDFVSKDADGRYRLIPIEGFSKNAP